MSYKIKVFLMSFFVFLIIILFLIISVIYYFIYPLKYKSDINLYSNQFFLDKNLVCSLINAESSFDKFAISNKGAIGLMQLMPETAKFVAETLLKEEYVEENLFDSSYNIKYGCKYLNYLFNKFKYEDLVICAYNAGETCVSNWLKNKNYSKDGKSLQVIPYKETNNYLNLIKKGKKYYKNRI